MSDTGRDHYDRIGKATYAYVGFLACGCCIAAVVDCGDKWTAKEVQQFIKRGYWVERKPMEWVRENLGPCVHKTPALPLTGVPHA